MTTYVGDGAWGTGKGAPLTASEHDGNTYDFATRIAALEAEDSASGVDDVTQDSSGTLITIHLSDGSTRSFSLPVAMFDPRGEWQASTTYEYLDLVTVSGLGVYLVLVNHTSSSGSFNALATDGSGNLLYKILFAIDDFSGYLRDQGTWTASTSYEVGDVVVSSDYGAFSVLQDHVSDDTFDPAATSGGDPLYQKLAGPAFSPVETVSDTEYAISWEDLGKYLRFTNEAGCVVTFPDDVSFASGAEVHCEQVTDGQITFMDGGSGVTIIPQRSGYPTTSPWTGAVMTVKYVGSDTWKIIGPYDDTASA